MSFRLRSVLFTPATQPKRFAKAADAGADLLIIDLEDAVAPDDKTLARRNMAESLSRLAPEPKQAVRINSTATRFGLADIAALVDSAHGPDFIVLPKCEAGASLQQIDALLTEAGHDTQLIALIESAAGLAELDNIARATSRLAALMLGGADLAADLGCAADAPNLTAARCRLVEQAVQVGVLAIDSPFFTLKDAEGLARAAADSAACGFAGRGAIHPAQVKPINAAFTPSAEAVDHARRVLEENRRGVGVVDGQMVDEALARTARRTLAAAGEPRSEA